VFDGCELHDLRVWRTEFSNVTFRSADLREAVLGGTSKEDSTRNSFHDVDFTRADMRGSVYGAAEFVRCKFNHAKLNKVDFQSSTFVDCSFEGELREVVFNSRGYKGERFPANEMKRVDLRRAKLRSTEFRGLDLSDVLLPEDDDHIVVENYPETLDRLLAYFGGRSDLSSRALTIHFEHDKKWLGPRQKVGLLNKHDLVKWGGEDGFEAVMRIIGADGRSKR
jgi:uncharacterized protein YjbI with pentapeptide repeats